MHYCSFRKWGQKTIERTKETYCSVTDRVAEVLIKTITIKYNETFLYWYDLMPRKVEGYKIMDGRCFAKLYMS